MNVAELRIVRLSLYQYLSKKKTLDPLPIQRRKIAVLVNGIHLRVDDFEIEIAWSQGGTEKSLLFTIDLILVLDIPSFALSCLRFSWPGYETPVKEVQNVDSGNPENW